MEQNARYFNDIWTLEDDFGMAALGDQLARVLLEAPPPFSARVAGKWGSGKTSVMRRAFATLGGAPVATAVPLGDEKKENAAGHQDLKFDLRMKTLRMGHPALDWPEGLKRVAEASLCIWYSPWQHQNEASPLLPLLQEVKAQFSSWMKLKEKAKTFNRKGGLAALSLMEKAIDVGSSLTLGKSVGLSGTVDKIRKEWKEGDNPLMSPGNGQRFHLVFEDAVKLVLDEVTSRNKRRPNPSQTGRLIIFVDDLDRCEESVAVGLLECIKLYLNTPNCVFVFGMDNAALMHILAHHWPKRTEHDNREYLEKLFQLTLAVPAPDPERVTTRIAKQIEAHNLTADRSADLARTIVNLLEPNPRKLKNFANSYCAMLHLTLPHIKKQEMELYQLLACLFLRENHAPIWRLIEREPWVFQLLFKVIKRDDTEPPAIKDDPVRKSSLGLMRIMIRRHFAHIFEEAGRDETRIHHMSEEEAVTHLLARLDQRRSDTALRDLLTRYFIDDYQPQDFILRCLKPKENTSGD